MTLMALLGRQEMHPFEIPVDFERARHTTPYLLLLFFASWYAWSRVGWIMERQSSFQRLNPMAEPWLRHRPTFSDPSLGKMLWAEFGWLLNMYVYVYVYVYKGNFPYQFERAGSKLFFVIFWWLDTCHESYWFIVFIKRIVIFFMIILVNKKTLTWYPVKINGCGFYLPWFK